jgi:hypothetical protein
MTSVVAAAGVFLLATLAPFETTVPILRLPWQAISNLEAVLALSLLAWLGAAVWSRRAPSWRTPLAWSGVAFVGAMAIAAAAAPADRTNAWHMTGRLAAAGAVFLLTVNGVTNRARLRAALALSVASGVVVAALATLEYFQVEPVLRALRLFRPSVTSVGAQIRAGGPLQYPTIASMYLEIVFAFGLGLMLAAVDVASRARAALWFLALLAIGAAITLTFTRAGLVSVAAILGLVGVLRLRERGVDAGALLTATLAVAIAIVFMSSRSAQSLWLRLTSESQEAWYRARVDAPAEVSMAIGRAQSVDVSATNAGRVVWDSDGDAPVFLSYHWMLEDGSRVVAYEGERTPFSTPVEPGSTTRVRALVSPPPQPGHYSLVWDLVQEDRLWFSTEPAAPSPTASRATVTGVGTGGPLVAADPPRRAVRPGRVVLWRAAGRIFAAHPLLGVGPDNFRLIYGTYAGLKGADPRTHSNNMYLEVLVGGGLLGAAAFSWLLREAVSTFISICKGSDPGHVAVAMAGGAIALHATVDSFLSFAPTYVLFALTLGFAAAIARGMEHAADAHRV